MLGRHPARVLAKPVVLQARGHGGIATTYQHNFSPLPLANASHRGLGAISPAQRGVARAVPTDVEMGTHSQLSASIDVQNTQHNYYDQRSMQVAVAVGVDPQG